MAELSFESDYVEGCHPQILNRFMETNLEKLPGYGMDHYCQSAKEKIKMACGDPKAEVYLLTGGTQTNQIVIDTMLDSHEGVIAAVTGHIQSHEAGAIEYTGHKVLTVPQILGKLQASDLSALLDAYEGDANRYHTVCPRMVYLSHPTEYGTLYTLSELTEISRLCRERGLYLFLDGARLGYGLMSRQTDVTLHDLARLCDVFYIGGTKVGALCGEAVVFTHGSTPAYFFTKIKQHGALLAKGRLLGISFDTLFTDDLYFKISRHAIDMAEKMKTILKEEGFRFFLDTPTNQIFIVLENTFYQKLTERVRCGFWEIFDENHTVVRFATSWATSEEDVEAFAAVLKELKQVSI
ncbi:MAG: low specificity L-threonine aldolase [Clostridia bacterium]|nr:low specificity L-threonine aldolase [Clostridia bacterium]